MKLSKYNIIVEDNDKSLIFNSYSSALIRVSDYLAKKLINEEFCELPEAAISSLRDKGILVDDINSQTLQYKYRYYKAAFRDKNPFLYIAPTMQCNFACEYCFENGNKHQGLMDDNIIKSIVRFLKVHGKDEIYIVWFGGEPMLGYPRILRLCDELKNADIKYTSSMITNGGLFNDENISQLYRLGLKFIQLSMDGVGDTQDKRRCFKGGKPTFEIVIKNLKIILQKTDIPVVIQVTIDRRNATAYKDMLGFCNSHFKEYVDSGRLRIGFNPVQDRTGFDCGKTCFRGEELVDIGIENINIKQEWTIPRLSYPCMYRTSWHFAIDPEGNLYKCLEHLGDPTKRVGSLRDDWISMERLSKAAFEESAFDNISCVECKVFPICGGGCPLDRINNSKDDKEARIICSKYKEGLERMLPHVYRSVYEKTER